MNTLSSAPEPAFHRNDRWLLLALCASALAHLVVLTRPSEPVPAMTANEPRVQVTLTTPLVEKPGVSATPQQAEPSREMNAESAASNIASTEAEPESNVPDSIDWRQQAREIIASQQPVHSHYEAPPLENHRFGKEAREARIPGLAEAFRPLNRNSETCGSEKAFTIGNKKIVMPVSGPCTREQKKREFREDRAPP